MKNTIIMEGTSAERIAAYELTERLINAYDEGKIDLATLKENLLYSEDFETNYMISLDTKIYRENNVRKPAYEIRQYTNYEAGLVITEIYNTFREDTEIFVTNDFSYLVNKIIRTEYKQVNPALRDVAMDVTIARHYLTDTIFVAERVLYNKVHYYTIAQEI